MNKIKIFFEEWDFAKSENNAYKDQWNQQHDEEMENLKGREIRKELKKEEKKNIQW